MEYSYKGSYIWEKEYILPIHFEVIRREILFLQRVMVIINILSRQHFHTYKVNIFDLYLCLWHRTDLMMVVGKLKLKLWSWRNVVVYWHLYPVWSAWIVSKFENGNNKILWSIQSIYLFDTHARSLLHAPHTPMWNIWTTWQLRLMNNPGTLSSWRAREPTIHINTLVHNAPLH